MAIKTAAEIERTLTEAARKIRKVREAAEAIKEARQQAEQESLPRNVSLIKPSFSPLTKT